MNSIFEIASKVSTPLALAGVITIVLFYILRIVVKQSKIDAERRKMLGEVVRGLFVLSLSAMVLGAICYLLADLGGKKCENSSYKATVYLDGTPKPYLIVRILELTTQKSTGPFGEFEFEYRRERSEDTVTLWFDSPDSVYPKLKDTIIRKKLAELPSFYKFVSTMRNDVVSPGQSQIGRPDTVLRTDLPVGAPAVRSSTDGAHKPPNNGRAIASRGNHLGLIRDRNALQKSVVVSYDTAYTRVGKTYKYSFSTENNNNVGCPLSENAMATNNQTVAQLITGAFVGGTVINPDCTKSRQYKATRVIFKVLPEPGFLLRSPNIGCSGPNGICAFQDDVQYLRNDAKAFIWSSRFFSAPVTVDFSAESYQDVKETRHLEFSSVKNKLQINVSSSVRGAMVAYNGTTFKLGESGKHCLMKGSPVEVGAVRIYHYVLE